MWEFLTRVLEEAGMVAVLYSLSCIGFALACKTLFERINELQEKIHQQAETHALTIKTIQDKRFHEAKKLNDRIVRHIKQTEQHTAILSRSLDILISMLGGPGAKGR